MRENPGDLVVFLGPSLPADEAHALATCTILPPAKAGDVFAILPQRPLAIALVDGVFEGAPSVWHHELLAALDAGIAVYGGASMGALRAAELWPLGVVGVGTVFGWYRDGALVDDDEVAIYHAPVERGSRPYTVPLVDVRWAIVLAARQDLLHPPAARAILTAAQALHFGERTWDRIFETARLSRTERLLLSPFFRSAPSLKAQDARATILAAAEWSAARRAGA
ncbi:MAG: TfuA-like protein, partial [Anaeromyxobacteraceae bacterium]